MCVRDSASRFNRWIAGSEGMLVRPKLRRLDMSQPTSIADALKARFKLEFDRYPESSRVRLHRAISWLRRAEEELVDPDARFLFLWIAFNAAYAKELGHAETERDRLAAFFAMLIAVDQRGTIQQLLFKQFSGHIRLLIDNRYVYEPFWRALREHDASNRWEEKFSGSKKAAMAAVMKGETGTVLSIVFDRLYVLRNQLVHGGATWNSRLNRAQVAEGAGILLSIVPALIEIMIDHPEIDFGDVLYPVV